MIIVTGLFFGRGQGMRTGYEGQDPGTGYPKQPKNCMIILLENEVLRNTSVES